MTALPGLGGRRGLRGLRGLEGLGGLPALLVITDRHQARHPIEAIADAIGRGGGRWLLLREKDLDRGERFRLAARLRPIARRYGMYFSVSADLELAAAVEASGVHLPGGAAVGAARARLGEDALIGVSTHDMAELEAAAAAHADYVTLSPIFMTASKPGYGPPLGVAALAAAVKRAIPVLALGGITVSTAGPCLAAGASGIAVMGEIMRAENPTRAVTGLLRACADAAKADSGLAACR